MNFMNQSERSNTDLSTATTNHNYVSEAVMLLQKVLGPFVERQIAAAHPNVSPIDAAWRYKKIPPQLVGLPISEWDAHGLLLLMFRAWDDVFKKTMGYAKRAYVSELLDARNRWAHPSLQNPISAQDAYHVWDKMHLILSAISAPEVDTAKSMRDKLFQLIEGKNGSESAWDKKTKNLKVGDVVRGVVKSIEDYGAFVVIREGVTGLLHVSNMSTTDYVRHPSEKVSIGQRIQAYILKLDREVKKIWLGMRPRESNSSWKDIAKRYPPGTVLKGTVCHIANYGVLVEIEPGISGLVHISNLSWTKRPQHPSDLSICDGQEITVMVLGVYENEQRIGLGYKQIQPNPWKHLSTAYKEGSLHMAKVVSVHKKGIVVELSQDVEVFVFREELKNADQETSTAYREGDELNLRVIGMNPDEGKLTMSEATRDRPDPGAQDSLAEQSKSVDGVLGRCSKTGEQVFLKKDAYGYYVQLGNGDKTHRTTVHPKMMRPDEVSLDIALQLLDLPREIGMHPITLQPISAGVGRYGPYVYMSDISASLGRYDDVVRISLPRAVELIDAQIDSKKFTRLLGMHPHAGGEIWGGTDTDGPYVKMDVISVSLRQGDDPFTITLARAVKLIDAKSRWM